MKRVLSICLLSASLLAPAAAHATPAGAPVAARLIACHPAVAKAERFAIFQGAMTRWRHSARVEIRFDLLARPAGSPSFQPVAGPGLGVWNRSGLGVSRYRFRKRVENLPAPAAYRAVVSFRWLGANGKVLGRAVRLTPVCHQPDPRPDLRVGRVTATRAGNKANARYTIVVRNDGRSAAGNFDVVLGVNGIDRPAETVGGLATGERRAVTIVASRCAPGESLTVVLDPDGRVDEANEGNDRATVPCPPDAQST